MRLGTENIKLNLSGQRGREGKISVKFYLNKKLKPRQKEGRILFPLYARVICKKQVSDFKIDTGYYSDDQLEKRDLILKTTLQLIEEDIKLVLELVHPFTRDNFTLANLPEILRVFDECSTDINEATSAKDLKDQLQQNGYEALIEVLNWKLIDQIENGLLSLQEKNKIEKFDLWKNPDSAPPVHRFQYVVVALSGWISDKDRYPSSPKKLKEAITFFTKNGILSAREKSSNPLILKKAVEFLNQAMELSTK